MKRPLTGTINMPEEQKFLKKILMNYFYWSPKQAPVIHEFIIHETWIMSEGERV